MSAILPDSNPPVAHGHVQRRVAVTLDEETAVAVAKLVQRHSVPKARLVALAASFGMDAVGDYLQELVNRSDELRAEATVAATDASPIQVADLMIRLIAFTTIDAELLPSCAKLVDGLKEMLLQAVRDRGIADPVLDALETARKMREAQEA